jgi:hypothetical protein
MKLRTLARGTAGMAVLAGLLSAAPAYAATSSVTYPTTCTSPVLYQPFLPFLDGNWYSLTPGESYDNFDGGSWTLSGGATTTSTTLQDGTTGLVLSLPKGSKAVSPPLCLNNTYPYMRVMEQAANAGQLSFAISYMSTTGTYGSSKSIGSVTPSSTGAWALSSQLRLSSGPYTGWNYAILTITGAGSKTTSTSSLYNLYLDPRMKH